MTQELDWNITIVYRDDSTKVLPLLDATYDWNTTRPVVSGGTFNTSEDPGNTVGARLLLTLDGHDISWFAVTASSPLHTNLGSTWEVEFMDDASQLEKTRLIRPVAYAAARPISSTIK